MKEKEKYFKCLKEEDIKINQSRSNSPKKTSNKT